MQSIYECIVICLSGLFKHISGSKYTHCRPNSGIGKNNQRMLDTIHWNDTELFNIYEIVLGLPTRHSLGYS